MIGEELDMKIGEHNPRLVSFFDEIDRIDDNDESILPISNKSIRKLASWESALTKHQRFNNDVEDDPIDAVIGFDFGTSCAKIIVRLPYEGEGGTSFAFPVPLEFRADEHPYCWKTTLFLEESKGKISLKPFGKAIPITDIKTSAMQEIISPGLFSSKREPLDVEQITVAYIGLLIRAVKGWVFRELFPSIKVDPAKRKVIWELNLGLPVAKLDNQIILSRFNTMSKHAWLIAENSKPKNLTDILNIINSNVKPSNNVSIYIRPEVVAQTIGFIQADITDFGFYAIADIGASTFDVCTFNYIEHNGEEKFNLFYADVQILGARALNWMDKVNSQFNRSFTEEDLKSDIQACIGKTIINTRKYKAPNEPIWSKELSIFLCGGGKMSETHINSLNHFKTTYDRDYNGTVEFFDAIIPENLKFNCDKNDYHRLSVAWGLSIPDIEFNKFTMPSGIEDVPKQEKLDREDRYIGPEQM